MIETILSRAVSAQSPTWQWGFFATSPAIIIPKLPKIIPNKFPLKGRLKPPIFGFRRPFQLYKLNVLLSTRDVQTRTYRRQKRQAQPFGGRVPVFQVQGQRRIRTAVGYGEGNDKRHNHTDQVSPTIKPVENSVPIRSAFSDGLHGFLDDGR